MLVEKHSLQPDTIINGKYNILMVIGKGGFSITYLAERIIEGDMVVIKELYNSEYMERLEPERIIRVCNDSQFEKDRKRFIHEWEVMKQFELLPGMVNPIDFFKDNNTMYIVMEHLSGGTLKNNVQKTGKYNADQILGAVNHALALLSEMHRSGVIHGDISPDNLVLGENGYYKLIDFGAVRKIDATPADEEVLRKEGYTPVEVYNKNVIADPRSDIYSICATLYYGLTSITPIDALERMIIDDLRPISEICPEIDPLMGQMIMKGLVMDPEKRWQSIEEMQDVISLFDKSEDERKKEAEEEAAKRKRRKRYVLIGIIAIFLFAAIHWGLTHKEFVKFKGADVQKIVLYYDDTQEKETIEALHNNILQKVEHLAGNDYLISQNNDYFEVTTAYDLFREVDLPNAINMYFNFSCCDIGFVTGVNYKPLRKIDAGEIVSIEEQAAGILLTLSQSNEESIKESNTEKYQYSLRICTDGNGNHMWDCNNTPYEGKVYIFEVDYDPNNGHLFISDESLGGHLLQKLFIDCLQQKHIPITAYNYSRAIIWEKEQESYFGDNQVDSEKMYGETVLLDYSLGEYGEMEGDEELAKGKQRLDLLEIPYALGWDAANGDELYIKVKRNDIWEIEAAMLFDSFDNSENTEDIIIKTESGISLPNIDTETHLVADNGNIGVKIRNEDELNSVIGQIEDSQIQLCIKGRPVIQTDISGIAGNGWIYFDSLILDNTNSSSNQRIDNFVKFMNESIDEWMHSDRLFLGALFLKSNGKYKWNRSVWDLPGCEKTILRSDIKQFFTEKGFEADWYSFAPERMTVNATYDDSLKEKYNNPFAIVKEFINDIDLTNEVNEISITIYEPEEEHGWVTHYNMDISQNGVIGTDAISWYIELWRDEKGIENPKVVQDYIDSKTKEISEYIASEDIFSACCLKPTVNNKYEQIAIDNDDLQLKVCVQDTIPGQNYQFSIYVENKTTLSMKSLLEHLEINDVQTTISDGGYIFDPGDAGWYDFEFSEDELHFSPLEPFRNASMEFVITYGNEEKHVILHIPDDYGGDSL